MGTVKFSDVDEWIDELHKDLPDRALVRLSYLFKPSRVSPNIRHLLLVGTHTVTRPGGEPHQLVRFEKYVGDLWGINPETDEKVRERGEQIMRKIESVCKDLKIEVRAGLIEGPE